MFRLRTTTTLSLLVLAAGVAGTQWLSGLNTGWAGPGERVAGFVAAARRAAAPARAPVRATPHRTARRPLAVAVVHRRVLPPVVTIAQAGEAAPPPELVPLSMPDAPMSWSRMAGHLRGRVLLHVSIDGNGRVSDAALAESSGDPVLDAHALASVRGWRFAVPPDHPGGFSGELPMRFTSGDRQVAQAP
ncbi:energy transducer TonB family protein [Rhodanobacter geophilus]|uniref:Energy transducer TonB n=1 Tax=Rhodanobacter geophilus TaxID=3162488 RepID=A0ABV3QTI1_9GAMM